VNDAPPDETRAVARLPGLEIEIRHRVAAGGEGEVLALRVVGTPDLGAASRALLPPLLPHAIPTFPLPLLAPWQLWAAMVEAAWRPWLTLLAPPRGPK
jgi:hypothetical protein